MNISNNFKIVNVFALAVMVATASRANDSVRPEFITADQPFGILRASRVGKYPFMFKCYPGINQLDVVYFGTEKKSGIKFIKKEQDLENLVPIRSVIKLVDNTAIETDKKYTGYRESYLGSGLESLFKAIGLYPSDGYKGTVLVDEYKAGLPMKWALCNVQAFKALKKYVLKSFAAANVVIPEVKPLLLVEIIDNQESLDASDYAFLNEYYQVLDPKDPVVKKFFESASKVVNVIADKAKGAPTVGGGIGEVILDNLDSDKAIKGFDYLKMKEALLIAVLSSLSGYAINEVWSSQSKAEKFVLEYFYPGMADAQKAKTITELYSELKKYAAIGLGSAAGMYIVYKMIGSMKPEADADDLEVEEVEETTAVAQV